MSSTQAQLDFQPGKIVAGRWKVLQKLGSGSCGSVFKVQDLRRKNYVAALKIEKITDDDDGVLKLEAGVLRKLAEKRNVIRLIHSGKRAKYSFIVMTMCGHDLNTLKRKSGNAFSAATGIRIAIQALYAIKQVHDVGFIHRDVKPGNMMTGAVGTDKRMIFLIDYGMCRSFVVRNKSGLVSLRAPRKKVLLRGTLRYCSLNVHRRVEQGRVDDLWAVVYTIAELCGGVPWNTAGKTEKDIAAMKESITDEEVFKRVPDIIPIAAYLRKLSYGDRPDYLMIYNVLVKAMKRENISFHAEAYDWEDEGEMPDINTALEYSEREKKTLASLPDAEVEYLIYQNTHPREFEQQKSLPI